MNNQDLIDKLDPNKVQCEWCGNYIDLRDANQLKFSIGFICFDVSKCSRFNQRPLTKKVPVKDELNRNNKYDRSEQDSVLSL